jgi:hypothetical protein
MAPERSGAGRVQVDKAVADGVLAYASGGSGAVSVSFGPVSTAVPTTLSRSITVQNTTATPVSFTATYAPGNTNPGASYRLTTSSCAAAQNSVAVSVPANSAVLLGVCLTITPSQLTAHPDPTLTLKPTFAPPLDFLNGFERSFISTASGRVVLTSTADGSTLRVPVYAAPRPASTMTQPSSMALSSSGSASLPLSGAGLHPAAPASGSSDSVIRSTVDAFELQGASGALPICSASETPPGCAPTSRDRAGDLKYVGFTSDGPLYTEYGTDNTFDPWSSDPAGDGSIPQALGYFGIATNWPWTSPDYAFYEVWIDIDGDGNPDAVLYNTRMPGSDIFVAELASVDSDGVPQFVYDDEFLNLRDGSADTNLFDSDVVTMPFTLAALKQIGIDEGKLAPAPIAGDPNHHENPGRISYFVDSLTGDAGGVLDSIGDPLDGGRPMTVDAADPGLFASNTHECDDPQSNFVADVCFSTAIDDQSGAALTVQRSAALLSDRPLGLLLLHHDDLPGQRAQVVRFASSVSATLAKPTAPYGYRNPLTVHVSSSVGIPPGTVTVAEGATKLATGTLHSGGVVLTLPVRSVGKHTLTVSYSGDVAHGPSSRTVSLTVTRASTHTTLSVSGTTSATLTATTAIVAPGAGLMSGSIRFYDNGHLFATLRTSGTVHVHRTLTHGRHTLTASYLGGSVLAPSSASRVVSV